MPPPEAERRPGEGGAQDAHGGGIKDSVYGLHIFPQHTQRLADSAITPELARARGYVSVDSRKQLQRYDRNFGGKCPIPGLLIPLRRKDGSVWGYQYRPDEPRNSDGKPRKYETLWQQRNGIDIPPGIAARLDDPSVPLLVTEGTRKADAAVSHGLAGPRHSAVVSVLVMPGAPRGETGSRAGAAETALPDSELRRTVA